MSCVESLIFWYGSIEIIELLLFLYCYIFVVAYVNNHII